MTIIGIIAVYTMMLQVKAVNKCANPVSNYSELGAEVLGPVGRKFVDYNIIASQLGFAIAYLIFIGQQMDQVVCFET